MKRAHILSAGALLVALALSAVLLSHASQPHTMTITQGASTVRATLEPGAVWYAGAPLTARWQAEAIQAIYFNEQGVIGHDHRTLNVTHCNATQQWYVMDADGGEHFLALTAQDAWLVPLVALSGATMLALIAYQGARAPARLRQGLLLTLALCWQLAALYGLQPLNCGVDPNAFQLTGFPGDQTLVLRTHLIWLALTALIWLLTLLRWAWLRDVLTPEVPLSAAVLLALTHPQLPGRAWVMENWGIVPYWIPFVLMLIGLAGLTRTPRSVIAFRLGRVGLVAALALTILSINVVNVRNPGHVFTLDRPVNQAPDFLHPLAYQSLYYGFYTELSEHDILITPDLDQWSTDLRSPLWPLRWVTAQIVEAGPVEAFRILPRQAALLRPYVDFQQAQNPTRVFNLIRSDEPAPVYRLLITENQFFVVPEAIAQDVLERGEWYP